jgi:hypothetical protein
MLRLVSLFAVVLLASCLVGCDGVKFKPLHGESKAKAPAVAAKTSQKPPEPNATKPARKTQAEREHADEPAPQFDVTPSQFSFDASAPTPSFTGGNFESSFSGARSSGGPRYRSPGFSADDATERISTLIQDSVNYGPTVVVWLLDRSPSAQGLVGQVAQRMSESYAKLTGDQEADRLLTAVVSFGQEVTFVVDPPSSDVAQVREALTSLPVDSSGREQLFGAIQSALEKYVSFRTQQRKEVIFIVVTDETGDDAQLVDRVIEEPKRLGIPFYVVGVPAPFGRTAGLAQAVEAPAGTPENVANPVIRQGPESRQKELIQLGYWGGGSDLDLLDSGFGPFALERLCQATEGRFLAVRPASTGYGFGGGYAQQWPSPGVYQFDPQIMRKYAPAYQSEADYQALITSNGAIRALNRAAQLEPVSMSVYPQLEFAKKSEAQMSVDLGRAQQVAAKLEPPLRTLQETLAEGEKDREKLTEPRLQAGYDLAMGRATAAYARISGYNSMLAALKSGKSFEKETSTVWMLVPADSIETTSALKRMVQDSKKYLERVIEQHPQTPWALMAERELQQPIGWKWSER